VEPLSSYIILSAALLGIGIYGLISKRNAIRLLISVEFIVNAANINFVAFARYSNPPILTGWNIVFYSVAAAAMEASGRQPEVAGPVRVSMLIAAALIEGVTFFSLVICLILALK
jgi:NADH-quinone oxidoreductase subunit K